MALPVVKYLATPNRNSKDLKFCSFLFSTVRAQSIKENRRKTTENFLVKVRRKQYKVRNGKN